MSYTPSTTVKMRLSDVRELLPANMQELTRVIGLTASIRLAEALGGTTIHIASGQTPRGKICKQMLEGVIGERYAAEVARHWPKQLMYIPRCAEALREMRNLEMSLRFEQDTGAGQSSNKVVAQLALQYKLSDRQIWNILKRSGGCLWMLNDREPDLFDALLPSPDAAYIGAAAVC